MTVSPLRATDSVAKPTRILCPIDLSDFSQPALAYAVALGHTYGAAVTVLHVLATWLPPATQTTYPGWMMQVPEARDSIMNDLHALVKPFAASGVALHVRTAEGDAASEIVRYARELDTDLIVMRTHGRSGFDRFTLGSVSEKVLRKAPCLVLTLPAGVGRAAK
jgi:nucleotide-binding universal stress UspA family protein